MEQKIIPADIQGTVQVPPSKSMAHRLLICAGLARGTSRITNIQHSKDMEATIGCLKALGAGIEGTYPDFVITGCDPVKRDVPCVLDCQESGSTIRFMVPLAALSDMPAVFHGEGRLLSRPMDVYADIFEEQNLRFEQSSGQILVQGPLQGGVFSVPGNVSSQFISGLLLAGPLFGQGAEIAVLPPYESSGYVDMTVAAMRKFGVEVKQPTKYGYVVRPGQYASCDGAVEGDYSQAAFLGVLAAIKGDITLRGLERSSLQSDRVIFDILKRCGATVTWEKDGVRVVHGALRPFRQDLGNCPDLGPVLCVLASYIPGTSVIENAGRLRLKESDRIEAMEAELKKWGVDISSTEDTVTITGRGRYCEDHIVDVDGHNDHRIVMAMAVFGLCADSESVIHGSQAVSKSWPDFFEDLREVVK